MKKMKKLLGITVLALAIGLLMAGCPTSTSENTSGNNGGGNSFLGSKLELSGEQVYTVTTNPANYTITYTPYTGEDLTFSVPDGGTATITGGKLSYAIETPTSFKTWDDMPYPLSDVLTTRDNLDAKVFLVGSFTTYDSVMSPYYTLYRANPTASNKGTTVTSSFEHVVYMYVTEDVTISREEKTATGTSGDGVQNTRIENDFSLALKAGWNAVCSKQVVSNTYSTSNPPKHLTYTETDTLSLSNPSSYKWILTTQTID